MKRMVAVGTLTLALFVSSPVLRCEAQTNEQVPELTKPFNPPVKAMQAAREKLPIVSGMVSKENFKELGFQSPEEAQQIQLGTPVPIFMVQLDKLKSYEKGADPVSLLTNTNRILYSLTVNGEPRSALVLHLVKGNWQMASVGRPNFTKALGSITREVVTRNKTKVESTFQVEIPALNLNFVGQKDPSGLQLTPLLDDPRFEFTAGRTLPAQEVFQRLAPYARELKTGDRLVD